MKDLDGKGYYFDEEEIALFDYFLILWRWKFLIVLIVALAVITAKVFFEKPPPIRYQAKAIIMSTDGKGRATGSRVGGNLGVIAQMAGISLPKSGSSSDMEIWFNSDTLKKKLIEKYDLLPVLFPGKRNAGKTEMKKIETTNSNPKSEESERVWEGVKRLQNILKIGSGGTRGTLAATAEYHDAKIAARLINCYLDILDEHLINEAKISAETNRSFLEKQLDKTSDPIVKQKIYNLIAQEIEVAMMSDATKNFAFKVIDPARVPEKVMAVKKSRTVLMSFIVSLIFAMFLSFILENIRKRRGEDKSKEKAIQD